MNIKDLEYAIAFNLGQRQAISEILLLSQECFSDIFGIGPIKPLEKDIRKMEEDLKNHSSLLYEKLPNDHHYLTSAKEPQA